MLALTACGDKANARSNNSADNNVKSNVKAKTVTIDWRKPSENKPYPNMNIKKHNWLLVSINNQRVYVMNAQNKVLYTMNCSTGANNSTPRGTYHIQAERGGHFYNASSKEGANYWTSWKDHGIYLFHSVPVDKNGKYVISQAKELGKKANSHGCIRLSIADAKWVNRNIPFGTRVVIK
ncbi:L,D-transpeptidase [Apilactobacillus xinyiensis]|uniref:L,D-transpeptidase n=1 Tax=Apilactobacillus xinyiensis TaxID=2841032 RepID=UPI001C7DC3DD|nr:L,D-transpeptidase [Apilactobacillus xinyiensis]